MPDRPDLPAVATPWEDPLGNVWCVTPDTSTEARITVWHWHGDQWEFSGDYCTVLVNSALLAGLGCELPWRPTIPPVPSPAPTPPKRVAKVVRCGEWQLAAKGDQLYERDNGNDWRPAKDWPFTREFLLDAAEAFAGAGDVLPGEAE